MRNDMDLVYVEPVAPEKRISDAFRNELGVDINPQALRIFIRTQWGTLRKAAHEIHDAS